MFTEQDAQVFDLPNSYEKLDELGNVYFPQLGALLGKANALITQIYGIAPNKRYRVSQTPTNSKARRPTAQFKDNRNNTNVVSVGLRADGTPQNLTKPNGKACEFHFASLAFCVACLDHHVPQLTVVFEPYVLRYSQVHKDAFAHWAQELQLERMLSTIRTWQSHNAASLPDLLRSDRVYVGLAMEPGIDVGSESFARLVIGFVTMFPLLDLWTSLSNAEQVEQARYWEQLEAWRSKNMEAYVGAFGVEPLHFVASKQSEAQVRAYFELLLGHKFPTLRPTWLKSGHTGASLELDGYCASLNLAFEYQGEYHYMYVPKHHKARTLAQVQQADALKASLCASSGVSLVQIPYWERDNPDFIRNALAGLDRPDISKLLGNFKAVVS